LSHNSVVSVNYFDKTGIFISAVVSAPFCAIAFAVVIMQVAFLTDSDTALCFCCALCEEKCFAFSCITLNPNPNGKMLCFQVYQAGQLLIIVKRQVRHASCHHRSCGPF
jgi:hypothetical protein